LPEPPERARASELFKAIGAFEPGEATQFKLACALRPALLDQPKQVAVKWINVELWRLRHDVLTRYLPAEEVERAVLVQGGVCTLNPEVFEVDVHTFLRAADAGDRARTADPPQLEAAISAYRRARQTYQGHLLQGREQRYLWVCAEMEGDHGPEPSLRDRYWRRKTEVTDRLAGLLVATGRFAEAAPLYAELTCDPGPPDPAVDGYRQHEYRERCARSLFACCGELGDLPGLLRARDEFLAVLERLAADADVALDSTRLEGETARVFQAVYARLSEEDSSGRAAATA
jgi:hypothetical protein